MVDAADAGTIGIRDRALILLGFAGAFRRSELVGSTLRIASSTGRSDGHLAQVENRSRRCRSEGGIPYGSNPETCPSAQCSVDRIGSHQQRSVFRSINRMAHKCRSVVRIDVARVVKKLVTGGLTQTSMPGQPTGLGNDTEAGHCWSVTEGHHDPAGHRSVQMVRRYIGRDFSREYRGKLGL